MPSSYGERELDNLWYIKRHNSNQWTIHALGGDHDYSRRTLDMTFDFTSDPSEGLFFVWNNDFYFVKNKNTGTPNVEVHALSRGSNYTQFFVQVPTWIGLGDQHTGALTMYNRNLYWVKAQETASGMIEVFRFDINAGYHTPATHKVSPFTPGDLANGFWSVCREQLAWQPRTGVELANDGWANAHEDKLVFVKTRNCSSGKIELHKWGMGEGSGYGRFDHYVTALDASEADRGYFKHSSVPDRHGLYFIKTVNTDVVEVQWMPQSNGYGKIFYSMRSCISPSELGGPNMVWMDAGQ